MSAQHRLDKQNLYARAMQLVGDMDLRQLEFTVQLGALASAKSSAKLGEATLVALCKLFLKRTTPD